MAWGFRKSISLGKLLKVNISRSGIGFSVGAPGLRVSVGSDGKVRRTISIPGTGLRNTTVVGQPAAKRQSVCPNCSYRVARSDRFCRNCGTQL